MQWMLLQAQAEQQASAAGPRPTQQWSAHPHWDARQEAQPELGIFQFQHRFERRQAALTSDASAGFRLSHRAPVQNATMTRSDRSDSSVHNSTHTFALSSSTANPRCCSEGSGMSSCSNADGAHQSDPHQQQPQRPAASDPSTCGSSGSAQSHTAHWTYANRAMLPGEFAPVITSQPIATMEPSRRRGAAGSTATQRPSASANREARASTARIPLRSMHLHSSWSSILSNRPF